jgi:hypothetical protein
MSNAVQWKPRSRQTGITRRDKHLRSGRFSGRSETPGHSFSQRQCREAARPRYVSRDWHARDQGNPPTRVASCNGTRPQPFSSIEETRCLPSGILTARDLKVARVAKVSMSLMIAYPCLGQWRVSCWGCHDQQPARGPVFVRSSLDEPTQLLHAWPPLTGPSGVSFVP